MSGSLTELQPPPIENDSDPPASEHRDAEAVALPTGLTRMRIDQIRIGNRYRKELGDIPSLMRSIEKLGVLQFIIVTVQGLLVAGFRRLEACKRLGWEEVPVRVVDNLTDTLALLQAEQDENTCREDLTPSEAVALGKAIKKIESAQSKQRQRVHGKTAPGQKKITGGNFPPVSARAKTRDQVGKAVGMSGRTYEKAEAVVAAAEENPAEHQDLVKKMDQSGKVDPAHKELKRRKAASGKTPNEAHSSTNGNGAKDGERSPAKPPAEKDKDVTHHTSVQTNTHDEGPDPVADFDTIWTILKRYIDDPEPLIRALEGTEGVRLGDRVMQCAEYADRVRIEAIFPVRPHRPLPASEIVEQRQPLTELGLEPE